VDAWISGCAGFPYAIPTIFEEASRSLEVPHMYQSHNVDFSSEVKVDDIDLMMNQLSKFFTLAARLEWAILQPLLRSRLDKLPANTKVWVKGFLDCKV
jgi:hypothetical protein